MDKPSYQQVAHQCVDLYASLPPEEFTDLDSLVETILKDHNSYTYDDLYEILPLFMGEVENRGIPLVMYKVPGPVNEPVFQRIRKIAERSGDRYPTSAMNLNKPMSVEELINELKKNKN